VVGQTDSKSLKLKTPEDEKNSFPRGWDGGGIKKIKKKEEIMNAMEAMEAIKQFYEQLESHEKFKFLFLNNIKKIDYYSIAKKEDLIKNIALKIFLSNKENRLQFFENCIKKTPVNIDKVANFNTNFDLIINFEDKYYHLAFKFDKNSLEFKGCVYSRWLRIIYDEYLKQNEIYNEILRMIEILYDNVMEVLKNEEIEKLKKEIEKLKKEKDEYENKIYAIEKKITETKEENEKLEQEKKELILKLEKIHLKLEKIQDILNYDDYEE